MFVILHLINDNLINMSNRTIAKPRDFVTFKDGLACTWEIKKKVRKHYNFK